MTQTPAATGRIIGMSYAIFISTVAIHAGNSGSCMRFFTWGDIRAIDRGISVTFKCRIPVLNGRKSMAILTFHPSENGLARVRSRENSHLFRNIRMALLAGHIAPIPP
ncbi:hypothetical protein CW713_00070 [Methanophagales archaeon]|nr:MAG: hypothetical protein CW713_00070 [Methanophagales archaeon]